ncbi:MAG: 50S ribosomal protein L11 methyltransferase [Gammaproteobacteria bacterium]|nr:50S ribosomal protein L11 methyltransferase [Gammaproteobacteria bacterium]NNC97496.1 50S ribosomal protein L11 methyltransferase [Gammaproteobacteria bacterium]NNM13588.1 50S ribosomal protein L11 methyltransferase [Gammaproteobacteria bacterium]
MAWNSITISLQDSSDAAAFEDQLLSLGAVAVTFTDGGDEPILEPELDTQPLWTETHLTALFEVDTDLYVIKAALENEFGPETYTVIEQGQVEDKVWEREWLNHFKPMRFGKRLWICPDGQEIPQEQQGKKDVIVDMDPGVAFGTGTHETTAMCLSWLDAAKLRGKTVLDFGCGSGILAIAALKLGARHATCIDIDIQAVEASLQNAERNNVAKKLSAYLPEDSDWDQNEHYDIILANILATPLIALAQDIRRRVKRGGHIVLSGVLGEQESLVREAYEKYFNFDDTVHDGDWVCITAQLKTPSQQLGDEEHVTYCPNCDESFYINADVLDRADGEVRCGECQTVFYAIDFIKPDNDDENSNLSNPIDTGKIPAAHMVTGLWMHTPDGLISVDQAQASMAEQQDSSPPQQADTSELELSEATAKDPVHDNVNDTGTETGDQQIETETASDNHEQSGEQNSDWELAEPDAPETVDGVNPEFLYAMDENVPLNLDDLDAMQGTPKRARSRSWMLLAVLSVLAFAAQYIHQHRAQLALHPSLGQAVQNAYANLPFELEPDWQLDAYEVNASSVSLNPRDPDELLATFSLTNTAGHAQIFPLIRLSMTNRWGERVAYRDLMPEDYLPENATSLMDARGRAEVSVRLKDPGDAALDYNVEVCLPKQGVIRCQEKIY